MALTVGNHEKMGVQSTTTLMGTIASHYTNDKPSCREFQICGIYELCIGCGEASHGN